MLQMEKNCRTHLEVMKEHKKQRMEELKGLVVKDRELCDVMCTTPFCINQDSVPSSTQLESYRAYLADLTKEKVFLIFCLFLEYFSFCSWFVTCLITAGTSSQGICEHQKGDHCMHG